MNDVGVVAIGRNEGERLRRCLRSLCAQNLPVVYVDSNSTDGSVALARSLGAEVVCLDMSVPFCAARARNEGFVRLSQIAPRVRFVQFVDGDCEVVAGWLDRACGELERRSDVAVVCGRRRERHPEASVFNRLADLEWNTPIGEARSCGGDSMMRVSAFAEADGFDRTVAAGEEPELCQRLREKGWKIYRIDGEMTLHDSAMLHFGQWWKRSVRSGYGAMDVATRFRRGNTGLFVDQVRRARVWSVVWPMAIVAGSAGAFLAGYVAAGVSGWRSPAMKGAGLAAMAMLAIASLAPLQVLRMAMQVRRRVSDWRTALAYGVLTFIGKWANFVGQLRYLSDRKSGKNTRLIDYKASGAPRIAGEPTHA